MTLSARAPSSMPTNNDPLLGRVPAGRGGFVGSDTLTNPPLRQGSGTALPHPVGDLNSEFKS
jgi:hypothetical protein